MSIHDLLAWRTNNGMHLLEGRKGCITDESIYQLSHHSWSRFSEHQTNTV